MSKSEAWMIATVALALAASAALAQTPAWVRQNPLPVGAATRIMDVCMVSADTVFVAGQNGEIGRTDDGGATWNAMYAGTDSTLNAVAFVNGRLGWVAGAGGCIARTLDGGNAWVPQSSGTSFALNKIQFLTPAIGFIVGDSGTVLRTLDSGRTWVTVSKPGPGNLQALFFINAGTGWVAGDNIIARTDNGGDAWELQGPTNLTFRALSFTGQDTGFAAESFGMVYRTVDGGAAWTQLYNFPTADIFWLYGLHFTDGLNGWAAGAFQMSGTNNDGRVMRTRDGGATWTRQLQTEQTLLATAFSDTLNGWCVGLNGALFKTADGGAAWNSRLRGLTNTLYSVFFADSNHGWAVGGSAWDSAVVLHTDNSGATWTFQPVPVSPVSLQSVFFTDTLRGWIAGYDGTILHTDNGGAAWTRQTSGAGDLYCIFFSDSMNGWAACGDFYSPRVTVKTRDGGTTWNPVTLPVNTRMYGVFFWNADTGFLVGERGTILKTVNGGAAWRSVGDTLFGSLSDIQFVNLRQGWITGSGRILGTGDGGETWTLLNAEVPYTLTQSWFTDSATGYAVATSNTSPFPGFILKTIDAGLNWQRARMADGVLWAGGIHFVNDHTGWVVSSGGTILKTATGGGITWSIPEVHVLSPAGGETWRMGDVRQVAWIATDESEIVSRSLWLSTNNGKSFTLLDSAAGSTGSWDWTVLADTASDQCLIEVRVVDAEGYTGKARSGGAFSITGTGVERGGTPGSAGFSVHPNPFNPGVTIEFSNPRTDARVAVFNVAGKRVKCFERVKAGRLFLDFNGLGNGFYFIQVLSDGRRFQRTITFIQ